MQSIISPEYNLAYALTLSYVISILSNFFISSSVILCKTPWHEAPYKALVLAKPILPKNPNRKFSNSAGTLFIGLSCLPSKLMGFIIDPNAKYKQSVVPYKLSIVIFN